MADPGKAVRAGNLTEMQFLSYCFIPLSVGMFPHLFQNCLTAKSAKSFRLSSCCPSVSDHVNLDTLYINWTLGDGRGDAGRIHPGNSRGHES